MAASELTSTAVTVGDVARFWIPEGQLWFLPWLAGVTVVAAATKPWRSPARGVVVLGLSAVLALAVWGFEPPYALTRGWALLLPFLLGCVVSQPRHAALARHLPLVLVALVAGTSAWLWMGLDTVAATPATRGEVRTIQTIALGVLGCAAGTIATLAVAALVARTPAGPIVAVIGRRSLEIFLAHIVVASGTRIVLQQAGVTDTWIHLLAGTVLGVVVPVVIAVVVERTGVLWLFGLPGRLDPARRVSAQEQPTSASTV